MALQTVPLTKSIRTGEGILVYVTNAVLSLAAILPNGLSWTHAALYLTILNSAHAFQRGLLKAVAVASGVGLAPIAPPSDTFPPLPGAEDETGPPAPPQEATPIAADTPASAGAPDAPAPV